MSTADEFKRARFATHPDGRIAARIDDRHAYPWTAQVPGGYPVWERDEDMARDGWSPLDETRPGRVTDEMVLRFMNTFDEQTGRDKPAPTLNHFTALRTSVTRNALTAALSAAPTTDEDEEIDWFAKFQDAARRSSIHAGNAAYAEHMLQGALDFAALWKETARRLAHDRRFMRRTAETAEKRLVRAEQERDEAIREAGELGEALDNVKPMDTMTAREHLDAAWEAAHVPANRTIPAGTAFMVRREDGEVSVRPEGSRLPLPTEWNGIERRLVDPPTPKRPDGAEAVEALITEYHEAGAGLALTGRLNGAPLADFLAERGVRAPEDGEE